MVRSIRICGIPTPGQQSNNVTTYLLMTPMPAWHGARPRLSMIKEVAFHGYKPQRRTAALSLDSSIRLSTHCIFAIMQMCKEKEYFKYTGFPRPSTADIWKYSLLSCLYSFVTWNMNQMRKQITYTNNYFPTQCTSTAPCICGRQVRVLASASTTTMRPCEFLFVRPSNRAKRKHTLCDYSGNID